MFRWNVNGGERDMWPLHVTISLCEICRLVTTSTFDQWWVSLALPSDQDSSPGVEGHPRGYWMPIWEVLGLSSCATSQTRAKELVSQVGHPQHSHSEPAAEPQRQRAAREKKKKSWDQGSLYENIAGLWVTLWDHTDLLSQRSSFEGNVERCLCVEACWRGSVWPCWTLIERPAPRAPSLPPRPDSPIPSGSFGPPLLWEDQARSAHK